MTTASGHRSTTARRALRGSLVALCLGAALAGCGGGEKKIAAEGSTTTSVPGGATDGSTTTTASAGGDAGSTTTAAGGATTTRVKGATPSTTKAVTTTTAPAPGSPAAKLQAAMLTAADVPGYTSSPNDDDTGDDDDFERCIPGNPMAKSSQPGKVRSLKFTKGPDTDEDEVTSAGLAGPSEAVAKDFLDQLGSQSFRDCVKKGSSEDTPGATFDVKVEAADATGGDQAVGVHVSGSGSFGTQTFSIDGYILFARKGTLVVSTYSLHTSNATGAKSSLPDSQSRLSKIVGRL